MDAAQLALLLERIPAVPQFTLADAILTFWKYDGNSSAEWWLHSFNNDCSENKFRARWKISNLDRVLKGKAALWWSFSRIGHFQKLELEEVKANPQFVPLWVEIEDELKATFNCKALKMSGKAKLKSLT